MSYPEKADLLLADNNLYLMSSHVGRNHPDQISLTNTNPVKPPVKVIFDRQFKKPRKLTVNL